MFVPNAPMQLVSLDIAYFPKDANAFLVFMKVEPGNILKLFLNFSNFEPQYSYRLYSY